MLLHTIFQLFQQLLPSYILYISVSHTIFNIYARNAKNTSLKQTAATSAKNDPPSRITEP